MISAINYEQMEAYADQHALLPSHTRIIVGFSGGADSMFLLHALCALRQERNITLIAAHLNHEWRVQASAEEEFCRTVATSLGIPYVSKKISELNYMPKNNGSREAMARDARRFFLELVCAEYKADAIALAHNAQDQLETFFIRLIRGASLSGLVGIRPRAGKYIRPLLSTDAQFLRSELARANIAHVHDTSNESSDFLRNRIRKSVVPALRSCDERFDLNFEYTLERLARTEEYLQEITHQVFDSMCEIRSGSRWISLNVLRTQPLIMQQRLLIHWLCVEGVSFSPSESFLQELLRFLSSSSGGTHQVHPEWNIYKKQQYAAMQKTELQK